MGRYGLPYKGSKSKIAEWVVSNLPRADTLVDLFCGGCAVTHAALLSGKWEHIIANDIHGDVPQLFMDAINGKYADETCWISREGFFARKDSDAYVRLCWSFGNDGETYMYGREIEPYKKRLHELVFAETPTERMRIWRKLTTMKELQSLESLARLQSLAISGKEYRDVEVPKDAVVYCDIPYKCTKDTYGTRFDYDAFFDWADAQEQPVLISEYNIDDPRFEQIAETSKIQLSAGAKAQKVATERLYAPKWQAKAIREMI